jgi:hypothetical protein
MPVDPRFTVRAYGDGDETAILDLFARSFPHAPRSLAHFDWKYRRNPFGNRHISLTFEGERLAGHYSGYPIPFREGRRESLAHQVGDTMTERSVRAIGKGPTSILGRTALHFYETFCERQVAFNYGFNVANIQKFSLRFLRSDLVEPVAYRTRNLDEDPIVPLPKWERRFGGWQLEVVHRTGPEWDSFFERVHRSYAFCATRNAAYVRWRYLECPDVPYVVIAVRKWRQLAGWAAFRIDGDRFLWGDALFDPEWPDAVEVFLRHIVPPYQTRTLEAWFPPRPRWFDRILAEHRLELHPEPQNLSVMCVPFTDTGVVARMREGLYYGWGDSDLF